MADKKIWFVTGAGRGMGVDIAKAALSAGNAVVATARSADSVRASLGEHDDLLAVELDITDTASAEAAVRAAVERFGRIDVLVNNAGNFYAGYFEEVSPEQMRAQIETNLFGPMNVTRAVLPVMRHQQSGHVVTISSTAGLIGQEFIAAYAASKFGVEGWMESLRFDVDPYGIRTTIVEPGFFRTELLVEGASTIWPELSIDDYAERTASTIAVWQGMNGQQGGDPAKLAAALVTITELEKPTAALGRRSRRRRSCRAEGQGPPRPGRRPPRTLHQPRPRRRPVAPNARDGRWGDNSNSHRALRRRLSENNGE